MVRLAGRAVRPLQGATKMNATTTRIPRARGIATALATLLLAAQAAHAADFPKSGQATFDRYLNGHLVDTSKTAVGNAELYRETAITRNVNRQAPFDGLQDVCLGQDTLVGGVVTRNFGTCVKTDRDGDKILVTFGEVRNHWSIVGGTGKYKGITGNGTTGRYESIRNTPKSWAAISREHIEWQIQ